MNISQKTKIILVVCLLCALPALPLVTLPRVTARPRSAAPAQTIANTADVKMTVSENYGKLPLSFEPNMGQSAKAVKFLSRGNGYTVFLTATEAVFSLRPVPLDQPGVFRPSTGQFLLSHGRQRSRRYRVYLRTERRSALFSPHAGGGHAWCYQDLARRLGEDQPFYGIQARQPETGLVAHTRIETMAAEYVAAIRSFQPEGPYHLCGWSMGGVIAFEMARQLRQQEQQVDLLALIDSQAPTGGWSSQQRDHLLINFARDVGLTPELPGVPLSGAKAVSPVTQLRQVWKEAKLNNLIPSAMTLVEFRKLFDVFKLNAHTMITYQPEEYQGRVTLFRTENLPLAPADLLKGWDSFAAGGVDLHLVPGDHFSIVKEPHVKVLAEQLRRCLP